MDRDDSRVLELTADPGLLEEALDQLGAVAVILEQHLDGQVAAEVPVPTSEDRAHAAASDLAEDLVPAPFVQRDHLGRAVPIRPRGAPFISRTSQRSGPVRADCIRRSVQAARHADTGGTVRAVGQRLRAFGREGMLEQASRAETLGRIRVQLSSTCRAFD